MRMSISIAAIAIIALMVAGRRDDVFLLNQSPSAPIGFYRRTHDPLARGAFVTVRARDVAFGYAHARGFTDRGDRFIKRVAATSGERVCAEGEVVRLPTRILLRLSHDASGRQLPRWTGCRVLQEDEVFLLGDGAHSFDSRYFGVVHADQIEGVWQPL